MVDRSESSNTMVPIDTMKQNSSVEHSLPENEANPYGYENVRHDSPDLSEDTTRTKKQRRGSLVRFSQQNDVYEISRPTNEEKKDMHMTKQDQTTILAEITSVLRTVESSEFDQEESALSDDLYDKTIEDLGLERVMEQQNSHRLERMKSAIFAILQYQKQSKLDNSGEGDSQIIDEKWLEQHYRPLSKQSAEQARSRGLRDQEKAPSLFPRRIVMSR